MDWESRAALVTRLADRMKANGSWCGETHLQKAVFFLESLANIHLGYEFVLYHHGPFSFDLRDDLALFRSRNLLEIEPQPAPYGPSYRITPEGLRMGLGVKDDNAINAIEFISTQLGPFGVATLERLATALFLRKEGINNRDELVDRMILVKPHVSKESAEQAFEKVSEMTQRFLAEA